MVGSAPQLNVAKTANAAGKAAKTTINSVEDLIASGTKMPKVKGATQLSVKGNADEIFNSLSKGAELIKTNQAKLPDGTLITKYSSSTTGVQTLQINQSGNYIKYELNNGKSI